MTEPLEVPDSQRHIPGSLPFSPDMVQAGSLERSPKAEYPETEKARPSKHGC
jgi:hypothetical protein